MVDASSTVVTLGAGQAGAHVAVALRREGFAGRIVLIGDEVHRPYERPALSKGILASTAPESSAAVLSDDQFEQLRLDWRPGARAEKVDRVAQTVTLAGGAEVCYDRLIFCTGGRALRPPIKGINLPNVFTLRTLDDCRRISRALANAKSVTVIGGGWIGLEVASTARGLGKDVTVIDRGRHLCERVLPSTVAARILELQLGAGVDVLCGTGVDEIAESNGELAVSSDGRCLGRSEVVIVGAGLIANDELAHQAGLNCDKGILVDTHCFTSDPNILACGDVAVSKNRWIDRFVRIESWQNAIDQAVVTACSTLGKPAIYDPLPWFWSDQHGVNIQIVGWPLSEHRVLSKPLSKAGSEIFYLMSGSRLMSAVAFNAPRELRAARKLIESTRSVHDEDLLTA